MTSLTGELRNFGTLSELHGEHLIVDVRRTRSLTRSDDAVGGVTDAASALVDLERELPHAVERLLAVDSRRGRFWNVRISVNSIVGIKHRSESLLNIVSSPEFGEMLSQTSSSDDASPEFVSQFAVKG